MAKRATTPRTRRTKADGETTTTARSTTRKTAGSKRSNGKPTSRHRGREPAKAAPARRTQTCAPAPSPTAALGVVGWRALDPVLLAALADEAPLLLVGPHGTGKSMLVERVAHALALPFRHYNASLIHYDDLVGIPMPDEAGTSLRFVGTAGAVWGAGFVFLDEISRCRPDLQNKLFPIVHERRVAGLTVDGLRHRWAAMNPPGADDDRIDDGGPDLYAGSEALDPALADRFPYVVAVPGWADLPKDDRLALLSGDAPSAPDASATIPDTVARVRETAERLGPVLCARVAGHVERLMAELTAAKLPQSPRRARMLVRAIVVVHAARVVLEGAGADLEESARLATSNALPQSCAAEPPSPATVLAAHRQAWEVSGLAEDSAWRAVLEEPDPVRRVALGDRLALADGDLSRLVTRALNDEPDDVRRIGLATAMFLRFRGTRDLWPSAWEPMVRLARRVLQPRTSRFPLRAGSIELERWMEASRRMAADRRAGLRARLERDFVVSGFPDLWAGRDWRESLARFREDLDLFGVTAEDRP